MVVMSTVEIVLEQVGSLHPGPPPVYTVKHRVCRATGIDPAVFVLYAVDDVFSHVATVREMETLPSSKAEVKECRGGFYRSAEFSRDWRTVEEQAADAEGLQLRAQVLALQWQDHATPGEFRTLTSVTPELLATSPGADL